MTKSYLFNTILSLLILSCLSINAQLSFEDQATSLGVGVSYGASSHGGGVSFCDFDGDGWDDITFATTDGREVLFYKNNNGTFTQVDFGINDVNRTKQVIWIDYDSDGDKDFLATSFSGINKFYRNDGNMSFTDITVSSGLFTENLFSEGASFGDIDNDGDLDVFISNRDDTTKNQRSYLYRNDNGLFVDVTESAGLFTGNQLSFCAVFFDFNNDGYQDIYVANDKSPNINRLYKNDGDGTFTDISAFSGAGFAIDAMSTTIGDYNNDGWFDIYVTNTTDGNYHLLNNGGDGTFTNVASIVGTGFYSIGWGAVFLDADNDTHLDLYVSGMVNYTDPARLPSAFYKNQGDDTFIIPSNIGFSNDKRMSFSNAIGDVDNDGFPDIIVMNDTENNFLWKNTTTNSNNWLKVKLQGVTSNRDGIGSVIEITVGGQKQYRYTLNGEGYLGQNSNTEFFGIGTATNIESLKITWLSGIVDIFTNVTPNQTLNIVEGQTLSVAKFDFLDVQLYPNPAQNKLSIRVRNNPKNTAKIELYNLLGEKIVSKYFTSNNTELDLSNLSSGVYITKLTVDDKVVVKKVIVE